ncbi:Bis(5'-adenosyl)-triphosphatase enpp4, partial [Bulinus truncatus]
MHCIVILVAVVSYQAVTVETKVLLISFDGFRYDYLNKASNIKNFKKLIDSGVTMPYMNNTFLTRTFPSHYTMATGLYEESHGIIGNKMYDAEHDAYFNTASKETFWWDGGEPIWVSAVKSGLKAASNITNFKKLIDSGVTMPYMNNTFLTRTFPSHYTMATGLYEESHGIIGNKMYDAEHDAYFNTASKESFWWDGGEPIKDKINIIVTSDHGMSNVNVSTQLIDITTYANSSLLLSAIDEGATVNLRPQEGKAAELVQALAGIEHLHVMLKENIPDRFHYRNHKRVMPVFAYADEGWLIVG